MSTVWVCCLFGRGGMCLFFVAVRLVVSRCVRLSRVAKGHVAVNIKKRFSLVFASPFAPRVPIERATPILSCPVLSCLGLSQPNLTYRTLSCPNLPFSSPFTGPVREPSAKWSTPTTTCDGCLETKALQQLVVRPRPRGRSLWSRPDLNERD